VWSQFNLFSRLFADETKLTDTKQQRHPMPKQTKAVTAMRELNDTDKRLASKLITTLKDNKLDRQSKANQPCNQQSEARPQLGLA
jgi:hypothetical protein